MIIQLRWDKLPTPWNQRWPIWDVSRWRCIGPVAFHCMVAGGIPESPRKRNFFAGKPELKSIWILASFCIVWICKYTLFETLGFPVDGCSNVMIGSWLFYTHPPVTFALELFNDGWYCWQGGWCCQNLWPWLLDNKEYHDARCQTIEIGPSQSQSIPNFCWLCLFFCCLVDRPVCHWQNHF